MKDTKKIRIQRVSTWSIIVTIVLAVIFAAVSVSSEKEFQVLRQTTDSVSEFSQGTAGRLGLSYRAGPDVCDDR